LAEYFLVPVAFFMWSSQFTQDFAACNLSINSDLEEIEKGVLASAE